MLRAFARNGFEMLMETGEIVKTALIAELLDAKPVVYKQFAGVTYTYFRQELRVGLPCSGFKIPAKRIGYQPCNDSYLVEIDFLCEMPEGIIINSIDTIILQFAKVMAEADGRKKMLAARSCKSRQTFDQRYDPSHSFRGTDLLYSLLYTRLILCADQDAPAGFVQQTPDGFGFR